MTDLNNPVQLDIFELFGSTYCADNIRFVKGDKMRKHSHYFKPCPYDEIDTYRIAAMFGLNNPVLFHALKKVLHCGHRGYKDQRKDISEAIDSLNRWLEMLDEDLKVIEQTSINLKEYQTDIFIEEIEDKENEIEPQFIQKQCPKCYSNIVADLSGNEWCVHTQCGWDNRGNQCESCQD